MSSVLKQIHYTAEEYLALERSAPYKSEFHDGQIYAMTGASREHNLITVNIAGELRNQLKKRPCEAYMNDMRVKAADARSYHYPDIVVLCGTPQFEDEQVDTLLNPTVLIEVLSPSTEAYDRGGKFAHYRKIVTLREYLLVTQDQPSIERYLRQGDGWILTEAVGLEASVPLESIDCVLSLREVYDKVLDDADNSVYSNKPTTVL
jgi:Uma2 family endonuclease